MKLLIAPVLLALAAPAAAQCTIGAPGPQEAAPPIDGWSGSLPIGFAFPFNGNTYTDFYYSDHGLIALNNGGVPAAPPAGVQVWDPGSQPNTQLTGGGFAGFAADVICAYWGDHTVGATSGVHIDNTNSNHMTITWRDSEPYLFFTAGAFTAQMTLYSDGRIVICLDDRCNNTGSTFDPITTVIGVWQDGSTIPAESDFSTGAVAVTDPTCFEEFTGPGPIGTNTPDPNFDLGGMELEFIPAVPGWIVLNSPLTCGNTTTVGTGCSGLALTSVNPPVLGASWDLTVSGVTGPGDVTLLLGVATNIPLGILAPLFGPTCSLYSDGSIVNVNIGPAGPSGDASTSLGIGLDASLKGLTLTVQGVAADGTGAGSLATTNGETGEVGY